MGEKKAKKHRTEGDRTKSKKSSSTAQPEVPAGLVSENHLQFEWDDYEQSLPIHAADSPPLTPTTPTSTVKPLSEKVSSPDVVPTWKKATSVEGKKWLKLKKLEKNSTVENQGDTLKQDEIHKQSGITEQGISEKGNTSPPVTPSQTASSHAHSYLDLTADDLLAVVDSLIPSLSPSSLETVSSSPETKKKRQRKSETSQSSSSREEQSVAISATAAAAAETPHRSAPSNPDNRSSAKADPAPPSSFLAGNGLNPLGRYDADACEWVYELNGSQRVRVGKLRGKPFVDVRAFQNGKPTTKGCFMSVETFRKLMAWEGLDDALAATANSLK